MGMSLQELLDYVSTREPVRARPDELTITCSDDVFQPASP